MVFRRARILHQRLEAVLGDKCRSDGMFVMVRGRQRYMHITIDSFTRFWTAYTATPNKAADGGSCLLRASARGGPCQRKNTRSREPDAPSIEPHSSRGFIGI